MAARPGDASRVSLIAVRDRAPVRDERGEGILDPGIVGLPVIAEEARHLDLDTERDSAAGDEVALLLRPGVHDLAAMVP